MAEINAKDLTTKTSPASTDSMLLFGTTSNEGAKITVDNLADNILGRLTTKTFTNQVGGSSAATILAQLATLNSNTPQEITRQDFAVDWVVNGISVLKYGKLRIAYFGNLKNIAAGANGFVIDGWENPRRSVLTDIRATNNQIFRINMKQSGGLEIYNYGAAIESDAVNTNFYLVYLVN